MFCDQVPVAWKGKFYTVIMSLFNWTFTQIFFIEIQNTSCDIWLLWSTDNWFKPRP